SFVSETLPAGRPRLGRSCGSMSVSFLTRRFSGTVEQGWSHGAGRWRGWLGRSEPASAETDLLADRERVVTRGHRRSRPCHAGEQVVALGEEVVVGARRDVASHLLTVRARLHLAMRR